jgi:phosphoribosylformylglycinamidine synthase
MHVGIVRYPGSNCDNDMRRYFKNSFYIWHKEEELLESIELLVIPGGFVFGDRSYEKENRKYDIEPGKMAIESPVTKIILEAVKRKIPILGVGNGFQMLVQLGLLPGNLLLNLDKKFTCKKVKCILYNKFTGNQHDVSVEMQLANSHGRYIINTELYFKMKTNNQIIMTYSDENEYNNGSIYNIAGICDEEHLIFGMMPQPEITFEKNIYNAFNNIITKNMDTLHP